ncbi:fer-1-like protein 6, partial [Trichonephila clavata]
CFEFVANFPQDSILHVQLFDWNLVGADALIGETVIDLENRFYSKHRPTCGLARVYETKGPNAWRDALKPTEILKKLCQESRLDGPHFEKQKIRIGNIIYEFKDGFGYGRTRMENMALNLLHRWKEISPGKYSLVPEHLETRTLYHPRKPAEPQVKTFIFVEIHNYNKICFIINFDFVEVCLSCDILTHNTSVAEFRNLMKHSMSYK